MIIIKKKHAERLRKEYIGRAMQGLLSNPQIINEIVDNNKLESKHEIISNLAIAQVDNLLKKL